MLTFIVQMIPVWITQVKTGLFHGNIKRIKITCSTSGSWTTDSKNSAVAKS